LDKKINNAISGPHVSQDGILGTDFRKAIAQGTPEYPYRD
jgi:hypothetical protein